MSVSITSENEPAEMAEKVEHVFFMNNDINQEDGNYLDTYEICTAVHEVIGGDKERIDGAQRIVGLWRVYIKDKEARVLVLCTGINLRGVQITLKDRNPFLLPGHEAVDMTRVYVRNIPLSYDNDEIENALKNMGVKMIGTLKYVRARNPAGKLTNFKTGDRFAEIVLPDEPLPNKKQIGIFTASIYHKEQKQSQSEIECGNCMEKGHTRKIVRMRLFATLVACQSIKRVALPVLHLWSNLGQLCTIMVWQEKWECK